MKYSIAMKNPLNLIFIFLPIFFIQTNHAVASKDAKLEYLGTFQFDLTATYFIDDYKMFSDFGPGKIEFKGGGSGKVNVCNENSDVIANEEKTIALAVSCEVIMDDGAGLRLQYYGRIVPGKGFYEKVESGGTAEVNEGIDSWFTGVVFRTNSKKYEFLNNDVIIGRGTSLTLPKGKRKGSVKYDLYRATY